MLGFFLLYANAALFVILRSLSLSDFLVCNILFARLGRIHTAVMSVDSGEVFKVDLEVTALRKTLNVSKIECLFFIVPSHLE